MDLKLEAWPRVQVALTRQRRTCLRLHRDDTLVNVRLWFHVTVECFRPILPQNIPLPSDYDLIFNALVARPPSAYLVLPMELPAIALCYS